MRTLLLPLLLALLPGLACAPTTQPEREAPPGVRPGDRLERRGDEIVVAGQLFHTGAPVVLWTDPGGYDAYRTERRFAPWPESDHAATTRSTGDDRTPNRYGLRFERSLSPAELAEVRGGGWTLEMLRDRVDQFVLHYDVCGVSARCFDVLHDMRNLSVHFMLDVDGTIYQTLDVKERAWHATKANDRSVGIEIANIGAYSARERDPFDQWYATDAAGAHITIPPSIERRYGPRGGVRDASSWPLRPARPQVVTGEIHGGALRQYDLTPQQYDSLIKLTAALHLALPNIRLDYPRERDGAVLRRTLTDGEFEAFKGVLGHWHVQRNKIDPGPAMDWEKVIGGARRALTGDRTH